MRASAVRSVHSVSGRIRSVVSAVPMNSPGGIAPRSGWDQDAGGLLGRISSYGFYDAGTAWKVDRRGSESATTAGLGLAMAGASLTGYVEVAAPLHGPDIEGRRNASVFAELSWRF